MVSLSADRKDVGASYGGDACRLFIQRGQCSIADCMIHASAPRDYFPLQHGNRSRASLSMGTFTAFEADEPVCRWDEVRWGETRRLD